MEQVKATQSRPLWFSMLNKVKSVSFSLAAVAFLATSTVAQAAPIANNDAFSVNEDDFAI